MTRSLTLTAAVLGLGLTASPAKAWHPCLTKHCAPYGYAKVPLGPMFGGSMGFSSGVSSGFSFGAPALSFGAVPMGVSSGFSFGAPAFGAFGAVPSGFSFGAPAFGAFGAGGFAQGADAQGMFDQFILQMLMSRLN